MTCKMVFEMTYDVSSDVTFSLNVLWIQLLTGVMSSSLARCVLVGRGGLISS